MVGRATRPWRRSSRPFKAGTLHRRHESAAVYLPAPARLLPALPDIKVGIYRSRLNEIPRQVMDREVDVGFVKETRLSRAAVGRGAHDRMICIASPSHPLAARAVASGREPSSSSSSPVQRHADRSSPLRAHHALPDRRRAWSFENIKNFVQEGVGLAIVPGITVRQELRDGTQGRIRPRAVHHLPDADGLPRTGLSVRPRARAHQARPHRSTGSGWRRAHSADGGRAARTPRSPGPRPQAPRPRPLRWVMCAGLALREWRHEATYGVVSTESLADVAAAAAPAVVKVQRRSHPPSGERRRLRCRHGADECAYGREDGLRATHDGRAIDAELAGWDPATGLAVLRAKGLDLRPAERADTPAKVGHLALAIGRSWSNALTVSAGIVSVIGGPLRTGRGRSIEQVIRTTAPVHEGFAGGAFVSVTAASSESLPARRSAERLSWIPAAIAWKTAADVLQHGSPRRGSWYRCSAGQPHRAPARRFGTRARAADYGGDPGSSC